MIKIEDNSMADSVCCIFKRCIETGIYPSQRKKANRGHVHQKGLQIIFIDYVPTEQENYRQFPYFHFLEGCFKSYYMMQSTSACINGLISPHQSGYRPGDYHSVTAYHIKYL